MEKEPVSGEPSDETYHLYDDSLLTSKIIEDPKLRVYLNNLRTAYEVCERFPNDESYLRVLDAADERVRSYIAEKGYPTGEQLPPTESQS